MTKTWSWGSFEKDSLMDSNGKGQSFKGEDGASTLLRRSRPVMMKLFDLGQVPCGMAFAQSATGQTKSHKKLLYHTSALFGAGTGVAKTFLCIKGGSRTNDSKPKRLAAVWLLTWRTLAMEQ